MSWVDLLRWEWFKLRGRRVIWALLVALLGCIPVRLEPKYL